jgi:CheY-like chemotaxis protein
MPNAALIADNTDAEQKLRLLDGDVRLLLAEDNPINREIALELLCTVGMTADCAENGEEAVSMAAANHYDVILMDLQMPHMDGLDAARAIRALPGREATPILAMTANAFDGDRRACSDAGMDDFVTKPVDPPVFFATLLKWLPAASVAETVSPPDAGRLPVTQTSGPAAEGLSALGVIPVLPGIDTDSGLAYARGRPDFYVKVLMRFRDEHAKSFAVDFHAAHVAADWPTAARLAHTLKGLSRIVGAMALGDIMAKLEQAATAGQATRVAEIEAEAGAELRVVVAGLAQLNAAIVPDREPGNSAGWREVSDRLARLLMERDTAAVICMDEFRRAMLDRFQTSSRVAPEYADELLTMSRAVARYDYAEALQLLYQLTSTWDTSKGGPP